MSSTNGMPRSGGSSAMRAIPEQYASTTSGRTLADHLGRRSRGERSIRKRTRDHRAGADDGVAADVGHDHCRAPDPRAGADTHHPPPSWLLTYGRLEVVGPVCLGTAGNVHACG